MRKSLITALGLLLMGSLALGQTVVSVVSSSIPNGTPVVGVPVNLSNASNVGGIQFSIKDVPGVLSVAAVAPAGRTSADQFIDNDNNGIFTPGDVLTVDHNGNGAWDGAFSVEYNDRDSTVSVLIFDPSGNSITSGNGPICTVYYNVPGTVTDDIVHLSFHEILDADPQFLLVVSDPEGNPVNAMWQNGLLTVGGIEVAVEQGVNLAPGLQGTLYINMANAVPVKGFQFNLVDNPNVFTVTGVSAVGRASEFTVAANEVSGQSMILGIHFDGDEIPPGGGQILEVTVQVSPTTTVGQQVPVAISNLIIAATGGLPLPSNGIGATMTLVVSVDEQAALPTEFALAQNYPNPFNPSTVIGFSIPEATDVQLAIYNVLGQEVRTLANDVVQPGVYEITWDGNDNAGNQVVSGVYFYRMTTSAGFTENHKLVKLK
jgi:hypothetical protein